jgi:hypothetical protein
VSRHDTLRQTGRLPGCTASPLELNLSGLLARLIGWILTVGAVSFGAPFWFDVLRRASQFPEKPTRQLSL